MVMDKMYFSVKLCDTYAVYNVAGVQCAPAHKNTFLFASDKTQKTSFSLILKI